MKHPREPIDPAHVELIRRYAGAAEQARDLHPAPLALAHREGWFTLLVPKSYGGSALALPALVALEEALAWADGSLGWVVTLCSGAGWFGGFIDPLVARTIFATPSVCLAGSGAPTGRAATLADGFRLDGEWAYASGALHATHFTANCVLDDDRVVPLIVDRKDVAIVPTWKGMGMVASASHSFRIERLDVAVERAFRIDAAHAQIDDDLYRYPFLQLAEATLAANLSGLAVHFVDLCTALFEDSKQRSKLAAANRHALDERLNDAVSRLDARRAAFHEAVLDSWHGAVDARSDALAAVSVASRALALAARQTVDTLYPLCGLRSAATDTEINRVWRDLHTAGQHALFAFDDAPSRGVSGAVGPSTLGKPA